MKNVHAHLMNTVLVISTVVGLGLAAVGASAAGDPPFRTGPSLQPKAVIDSVGKLKLQTCITGFSKGTHPHGYSCTSGSATCTAPLVVTNLHVEGNRFAYLCVDPSNFPK